MNDYHLLDADNYVDEREAMTEDIQRFRRFRRRFNPDTSEFELSARGYHRREAMRSRWGFRQIVTMYTF